MNVEVVSTMSAVKYLYKYILKGGTRAAVQLRKQAQLQQSQPDDQVHNDEIRTTLMQGKPYLHVPKKVSDL